ncbi:hypothetical protein ACPPVO_27265 [Dactylosporangium sp. McL0621]|uniref:hypothetical protein n=1 Tax=Dactylosporangium sp. McL0621 TaxID=3415678 RepID=UPI003CE77C75
MTSRLDHLLAEVDRQLGDVREQSAALAGRAGLLLAAGLVGAVVLAAAGDGGAVAVLLLVALVLAMVAGVGAVVPALAVGPGAGALKAWAVDDSAEDGLAALYAAKLLVLEANRRRLVFASLAVYGQAAAALVATVLALVLAARR